MIRKLAALLCALFIFPCLAGCGKTPETDMPKTAICFAAAGTANAKGLNINAPQIQELVYDAIRGYGFLAAVSIDGEPEVLMADSFDIPESYKRASKSKLDADAAANTAALLTALGQITADDPEADYLEGLRLAARSLSGLEGYESKRIVMLGTGLSTAGALNFRNNLLSADPDTLAALLAERKEIPDLTGITVTWLHLGDVADPQPALSPLQRSRLEAIWQAIVERGGGSFQALDVLPEAAPAGPLPAVSVVELAPEAPIAFAPEADLLESPIVLTEEQVTFVGDRADYLHPDAAGEAIAPIAEYLREHPQLNILLVGTTAGDSTGTYCDQLSQDRAETVKNTLIGLGVSESRITAIGMGSGDPWHISGVGTDGPLAAANRKVVILDAACDTAQKLLKS